MTEPGRSADPAKTLAPCIISRWAKSSSRLMRCFWACFAGAVMLVALAVPSVAATAESSGKLTATPSAGGESLPVGVTSFSFGAFAYRPANAPGGPLPLLVLLHGSDGQPRDFLESFRPVADKRGYQLLALKSADWNWDIADQVVRHMRRGQTAAYAPQFGADVPRIDAVLHEFFARAAVDPKRVVLLGFSDGAGYALCLGLANPQLFPGVVALSPGFAKVPDRIGTGQRVFIAHGRSDRTLPFRTARGIAESLSSSALSVRFFPFNGDHVMTGEAVVEGLAFAFAEPPSGSGALPPK